MKIDGIEYELVTMELDDPFDRCDAFWTENEWISIDDVEDSHIPYIWDYMEYDND